MIWWVVDNANLIYLLFTLAALFVGVAAWQTRRVKYLVWLGIIVALAALFWFLCSLVITDRKQVELNIDDMARATLDRNASRLMGHLATNFEFQGHKRKQIADAVIRTAEAGQVNGYRMWDFSIDELSRPQRKAKVTFRLRIDTARGDAHMLLCRASFVLEGDRWLLTTFQVFNPVANTDQPIGVPLH